MDEPIALFHGPVRFQSWLQVKWLENVETPPAVSGAAVLSTRRRQLAPPRPLLWMLIGSSHTPTRRRLTFHGFTNGSCPTAPLY